MAVTLDYNCNPTRTLAVSVDAGDGSKIAIYGRDLRNTPIVTITNKDALANNAIGGGDLALSAIFTIAPSGTLDIDLQAFIDVAQRAAQSFARVKSVEFWLLGVNDVPAGTVCSGVTITPGGTNGWNLFLADATSGLSLPNTGRLNFDVRTALGLVVDATHKVVHVVNDDAGVAAKFFAQIVGGGT